MTRLIRKLARFILFGSRPMTLAEKRFAMTERLAQELGRPNPLRAK